MREDEAARLFAGSFCAASSAQFLVIAAASHRLETALFSIASALLWALLSLHFFRRTTRESGLAFKRSKNT